MRLGIAVLSASYRAPALAAKMTSVLDVIADGRLVVGLGTGSDRAEHAAYGYPFGTPAERTSGLTHALDVMQSMQTAPDGASPNQPASQPPIWLAAHKPRLLRLAGERADGVIAAWIPPQEFAHGVPSPRKRVSPPAGIHLAYCLYTFAFAYPSEREAMAWLAARSRGAGDHAIGAAAVASHDRHRRDSDEVRDQLAAYGPAGATDVVVAMPSRVPLEAIDALAASVLARARPQAPRTSPRAGIHRQPRRSADPAAPARRPRWRSRP